jgi:hypothetical protein
MSKRSSKKINRCVKQTSKKYTSRPSPPYPANECINQIKIGNDGKKYISLKSFELEISKWYVYSKELLQKRKLEQERRYNEWKQNMKSLEINKARRRSKGIGKRKRRPSKK